LQAQTLGPDQPVPRGMTAGNLHLVLGDQQVDVPVITITSIDPPGTLWRVARINF
jgi:hypothetical protein